ncbi:hypothetical protein Prudu_021552, partial [Prunus dulcis]
LSLFSPVSPFSLLPQQPSRDLRAFQPFPRHHTWGRSLGLVPNEAPLDGEASRASAAAAVVGIGRNPPWKPTVRPNATRTSSSKFSLVSPPNRSSKAPGAQQECKRDLRGVEAIEVRGIHRRASHSFRTTKGDSAEFSAEV